MSKTDNITVELTKDFDYSQHLVEGSILQSCKEYKRHYTGILDSINGQYIVKVPKQYCKIVTNVSTK